MAEPIGCNCEVAVSFEYKIPGLDKRKNPVDVLEHQQFLDYYKIGVGGGIFFAHF